MPSVPSIAQRHHSYTRSLDLRYFRLIYRVHRAIIHYASERSVGIMVCMRAVKFEDGRELGVMSSNELGVPPM